MRPTFAYAESLVLMRAKLRKEACPLHNEYQLSDQWNRKTTLEPLRCQRPQSIERFEGMQAVENTTWVSLLAKHFLREGKGFG